MPDWFDVKKWPEARFVTTGFEKGLDRDAYVARGTLMIRDKTVPITLPFTLTIEGNRAEMRGETSLNRLDAGVGQGQWSDTKSVGAEVKIRIHVVAVR
jgi:cytochrome b561